MRWFCPFLLLFGLAWAELPVPAASFNWPSSYTPIRLIATPIGCSWREGRPIVSRCDVARLLHLSDQGDSEIDLIEALSERNWLVSLERDGTLVARPPAQDQSGPLSIRETDESLRALHSFAAACSHDGLEWVKNDPRQALVNAIGADIAKQARRPIPWTFAIVRSRQPNAACTGEGMVYVTTGLLDLPLDHDELAGVLGHEVAHGARQQLAEDRSERSKVQKTSNEIQRAKDEYTQTTERAKDRYIEQVSKGHHQSMAELNYRSEVESAQSRLRYKAMVLKDKVRQHQSYQQHKAPTDERQADLAGIRYAMAAGYRPDGLLRALVKLQNKKFHSYATQKMLGSRTHPPISERIRALEEILSKPEFHWINP